MKSGAVTFAWDDGEVRTISAPEGTLDTMKSAWEWIDLQMKELQAEKSRPRTICFRLSGGEFRGLRFPDWRPGLMDETSNRTGPQSSTITTLKIPTLSSTPNSLVALKNLRPTESTQVGPLRGKT